MDTKLNMLKGIHSTTLKALSTSDPRALDTLIEKRGEQIKKFASYLQKLNTELNARNIKLEFPEEFLRKYDGYVQALTWNSTSLYKKLEKDRKQLASELGGIHYGQNIAKYVKSGMRSIDGFAKAGYGKN